MPFKAVSKLRMKDVCAYLKYSNPWSPLNVSASLLIGKYEELLKY